MRTAVVDYDLSKAPPFIWGLEGYDHVYVLVRSQGRPLEVLRWGRDPKEAWLSGRELEQAIEYYLSISPAYRHALRLPTGPDDRPLPPISVIVCTRNRPLSLSRCLASLVHLDYETYEVIVVDNASETDQTARLAAERHCRYIVEPRLGLDWARNRGAAEASYDIVAYTDDDVEVDPCWLRGVARGFRDPAVVAVTGLVLPSELETRAQHWFETRGNGMNRGLKPQRFDPATMTATQLLDAQAFGVGANMAFRRGVLAELGGFDTALDVGTQSGGAGDHDMFHRVLAAGKVLRYEPHALVWHRHRRDMRGLRRQLYDNGRSYGVYLIKRWCGGRLSRWQIARFAVWRWGRWLVGRLILKLLRRHRLPMTLLWAEFWGALHAPRAYITTYRHDQRLRREFNDGLAKQGCPSGADRRMAAGFAREPDSRANPSLP